MNVVNLTLKPTGHDQTTRFKQGWVMASTDRRTAVSLYPSVVAVQTANYDHYRTSLGDPLTRVLQLSSKRRARSRSTHRPQIRESVAELRSRNAHLLERARTRRVCWSLVQGIAPLVEALHQQVQLRLDDTAAAQRYRVAFFVSKALRLFIAIW